MKFNRGFWIASALLVVWLLLGWFLGSKMGLVAPAIWYLRAAFWLLGIAGFVGYLLLRPKDQAAPAQGDAAVLAGEIDANFLEAAKRIQGADSKKKLNGLPAIFLLGDSGSAKTSILTQSGIQAELVAGQALRDGAPIPTRSVNLWYSRETLFIDPAGSALVDPAVRRKLFKKFVPVQLNSLLASKTPATRSVVVTLDCDTVLQPGGANAVAEKARQFHAILSELSHELGASFPVYVLFTKADKLTYFRDFVENLTEAETSEVLGVSLPVPAEGALGAYAEQQSQRLDNAFQSIYYSLADRRPVYLAREHVAANLSNVYEFPREFAKLRALLVPFLTDLCKPSQLGSSPFLRGFYFAGVRAVTINDVVPALQVRQEEDESFDAGATRMFTPSARSAPLADARPGGSRRVPQWVFVRNLFPEVFLADRVGAAAAQTNVKVNFARRLLLGAGALAALVMAVWWTVSYFNNSQLVHDAVDAAHAVPAAGLISGQLASADSLQRLSRVRETLAVLNNYEHNGAPMSYRALLYKGSDIRRPLREIYYALFRRLLLEPTQQTLVEISRKPEPYEPQGNTYVYNVLKAYLITKNFHEKQWGDLPNVLTEHWKKDQNVDSERERLAASNFKFYAAELPEENPYPAFATPDEQAVTNARAFLRRFAQSDRIYKAMLDAAGDKLKPIVFNRDYPGTADTVKNMYPVPAAFVKQAYINFQKQLQKPDAYFTGEEWVLGKETVQAFDKAKMVADLRARYDQDFVATWREYLKATSESIPYPSYARAATVLQRFGSPNSPLMQLFCVASNNTSVPTKEVAQAFQPVQTITPPGCETQLVSASATPYVGGLGSLANAVQAVGSDSAPNVAQVPAAQAAAQNASNAENSLYLLFRRDPADPSDLVLMKSGHLLKDPIDSVTTILGGAAAGALNAQAAGMCAQINPLFNKYPFNPKSSQDASIAEVGEAINPQTGKLWAFVKGPLASLVQQAGNDYIATPGQPSKVTSSFLAFLNRAAHMSQALYHDASGNPSMTFTIQALPSDYVDHVSMMINGVTLSGEPRNKPTQTFPWPGASSGFSLKMRLGSGPELSITDKTGLWAVWHSLERAERGVGNNVQWSYFSAEGPVRVNGQPVVVKFSLDQQSSQILRPQYFAGLSCPSKAVQ